MLESWRMTTKNHPSDASCHATQLTVFDKIKLYHHLTSRVSQLFQTKLSNWHKMQNWFLINVYFNQFLVCRIFETLWVIVYLRPHFLGSPSRPILPISKLWKAPQPQLLLKSKIGWNKHWYMHNYVSVGQVCSYVWKNRLTLQSKSGIES